VEDSLNYTKIYNFWLFPPVGTRLKNRQVLKLAGILHRFPQDISYPSVGIAINSIE
jgi:hypothetical protein